VTGGVKAPGFIVSCDLGSDDNILAASTLKHYLNMTGNKRKRNLEIKINNLMAYFPVAIILGVRQCGKTNLAMKSEKGVKS
jgi:predicted AAA+ superfamily ATPase